MAQRLRTATGALIFALATIVGAMAFASPFLWLAQQQAAGTAVSSRGDSPLMLAGLIGLCVAALVVEAQGTTMSVKLIALLAVLVAINSALRLAETILPGPGGFTPIFMLVIATGYVFGAKVGFLMGALTMLVSAFVTGGVGPWLPYQMFAAGWMGLSAGWMGLLNGAPVDAPCRRRELAALIAFGAVWGFLYGLMMNLWEWPFQAGDPAQSFAAGITVQQALQRYAAFYIVTSAWWDAFGALGNAVLLLLFGRATINVLRRHRRKMHVEVSLEPA